MLVDRTQSHSRGERPMETHPEDLGLLLNSQGQKQGLPGASLYHTPTPKCLTQNVFFPDELSYQDVWQHPFLLTIAYALGLQYWVEKLNPPESPDFHPLVGSVIELREMVKEHITFTNWDLFQGLGRVNLGAMSQWPHPSSSSFSRIAPPLGNKPSVHDTSFTEATTQTASLATLDAEPTGCITPLDRIEEENWYMLVVTTSIRQLNLGSADNDLGKSSTALPGRDTFQNPCM